MTREDREPEAVGRVVDHRAVSVVSTVLYVGWGVIRGCHRLPEISSNFSTNHGSGEDGGNS